MVTLVFYLNALISFLKVFFLFSPGAQAAKPEVKALVSWCAVKVIFYCLVTGYR